jgi:DNA (cytosine-5)-methyltransferase 1
VLSLFAGIGGIDLGLEAHGCTTVAYSEVDPYASAVMAQHFPDAVNLGDVTTIDWEATRDELGPFDIICGGFPCQDISLAGKGAGIADGTRSGLWSHYADAIRILRPRGVLVENVAALLARGIDRVLGDLAACGYDAEWDCVPAAAVGAPHRRDRLFICAYPNRGRQQEQPQRDSERRAGFDGESGRHALRLRDEVAYPEGHDEPHQPEGDHPRRSLVGSGPGAGRGVVGGDSSSRGGAPRGHQEPGGTGVVADAGSEGLEGQRSSVGVRAEEPVPVPVGAARGWARPGRSTHWEAEPDVGRVADGVPRRVDRLRCLGNAVVPQVAEHVAGILLDRIGVIEHAA